MVATLDFESFVASVIRENLVQFEDAAADAREQQGIAQKGLGNRVISNTPVETEELPAANNKVSTASRVLTDMSDYYEPDEFPTQEVRVDRAPRFSNINRSTVLDILSANRDGLEKKGIVKMPMGMLRKPDPTLDIDGLQSRLLDKLNLRPPEGSPQDIQYGAELQKLGEFRDDYTSIDVDRDAPAGGGQDNQPNVDDRQGLGSRKKVELEKLEPLGETYLLKRLYAKKGKAYRDSQIVGHSYINTDLIEGGVRGNSRIHGDASIKTQNIVINKIIKKGMDKGLSDRDIAIVLAIAKHESGFNPDAAAGTTSARGIGQFINRTGAAYGLTDDNQWDVDAQIDALIDHTIDNKNLADRRDQGEEYIYKYHHDGPTSDYVGLTTSVNKVVPLADKFEKYLESTVKKRQTLRSPKLAEKGAS